MIGSFLYQLAARDPLLFWFGALNFALFAVLAVLSPLDTRLVTGINPWIKPMKFCLSVGLYVWAVGWLLPDLPASTLARRVTALGVFGVMAAEQALIVLQAVRGVPSHFNNSTRFDLAIFHAMGILIALNALFGVYLLARFSIGDSALPPLYLWSIRLGLLVFLLAGVEGSLMVARMAHTVGAPDSGPGLPFLNWSRQGGDLRISHFLGLHALQLFPLAGWVFTQLRASGELSEAASSVGLAVFIGLYIALCGGLLAHALAGRPLLGAPPAKHVRSHTAREYLPQSATSPRFVAYKE